MTALQARPHPPSGRKGKLYKLFVNRHNPEVFTSSKLNFKSIRVTSACACDKKVKDKTNNDNN